MRIPAFALFMVLAASVLVAGACSEFTSAGPAHGGAEDAGPSADAGHIDAQVGTDGVDAAAAGVLACPTGATCLGFEDGTTGDLAVTGDCEIVEGIGHGGGHSAHCKGTDKSYYALNQPFAPDASLAFRAFVRGVPPAGTDAPSLGYVGFLAPSLGIPFMMVGDANTRHYDLWWSSSVAGGQIVSTVPDGSPTWTCVEAVFAAPAKLSYFVNGSQVGFTLTDATLGTVPLSFQWGLPYRPSPSGFAEVYVDDIAIGTTRLGCE